MKSAYKKIDLAQGSPEWLRFRQSYVGGSDMPALTGNSPYNEQTPVKVWYQKMGLHLVDDDSPDNEFIFNKGHKVEKIIRQEYEDLSGHSMNPAVVISTKCPHQGVSLDGLNEKAKMSLEAKFVGKDMLERAKSRKLRNDHFDQVQYQMLVTGFDQAEYFCHDGKSKGVLLTIDRDENYIKKLDQIEREFWELVEKKVMPKLTEKDYLVPNTAEDLELFKELRDTKEQLENLEIYFKDLREKIIGKYDHPKLACSGVKLVKVTRQGSIDYKKIPEVQQMQESYLEQFRGKSSDSWRVTFDKPKGGKHE